MSQADPQIIALLNTALKNKLTSINQYFLHARMLKHKGNVTLADYEYKASIDSMKHSDMLVEQVLALGGAPLLQELGELRIGETEQQMLKCDLALAEGSLVQLRDAIAFCENRGDKASAALLSRIAASKQENIDFIKSQLSRPAAA